MFSQAIAHFPENQHRFLTISSQNSTTGNQKYAYQENAGISKIRR